MYYLINESVLLCSRWYTQSLPTMKETLGDMTWRQNLWAENFLLSSQVLFSLL